MAKDMKKGHAKTAQNPQGYNFIKVAARLVSHKVAPSNSVG